jgi:hypothetical protein
MHIRSRVLPVCSALAVALLVCVSAVSAQDKKPAPKPDKAQQAEIAAAVKIIDDVMAGQPAPTDYKFTWTNHSMKSRDNKAYVPFILAFEKGQTLPATATYYIRAVNKASAADNQKAAAAHKAAVEKAANLARLDPENTDLADAEAKVRASAPKVEYAFEDLKFVNFNNVQPTSTFRFPAAMGVAGGDYDVYVLIKESAANLKDKKAQPKAGLLKVALTVPNYWTDELAVSSVIVTNVTEQLKAVPTPEEMIRSPYIFGLTKVTPSADFKFAKKDELSILFYIYNTGLDKTTGKPDLTVDYSFYVKAEGKEKFFNKTNPQLLNASTLGAQFDPKAGHQLLGGQGIPLASFPEGEYRLEIKITDKVTGKTKVENSLFTVTAG